MARVTTISEGALEDRVENASAHVWQWLANTDQEVFDFRVKVNGKQRQIEPDDPATIAKVTLMVHELATLIAEFSVFPHAPEA